MVDLLTTNHKKRLHHIFPIYFGFSGLEDATFKHPWDILDIFIVQLFAPVRKVINRVVVSLGVLDSQADPHSTKMTTKEVIP